MIVAIHQPQYLPWLPYCDKVAGCDLFVYLDNVQYQKNGVQNRNQIKTAQGAQWLTVPVRASLERALNQTELADDRWPAKHLRTLRQNYGKAAAAGLIEDLASLIERPWPSLAELNIAVSEWIFDALDVTARRVRASELGIGGGKEELVVGICRHLGAKVYLSGPGARTYQSAASFAAEGIELRYHRYAAPTYPQCHRMLGFVPDLSVLDLMLNTGTEAATYVRSGRLEAEVAT